MNANISLARIEWLWHCDNCGQVGTFLGNGEVLTKSEIETLILKEHSSKGGRNRQCDGRGEGTVVTLIPKEIDPRERTAIFGEIHVERQRQDKQWGGPAHDDDHEPGDWSRYISYQLDRMFPADIPNTTTNTRTRLVKIAALAVAAIESLDRTCR